MIQFDEVNHVYSVDGHTFKHSVTELVSKYKKPFAKHAIASACAKRESKDPSYFLNKWDLNAQVSVDFGNAIHKAVSYFLKYSEKPKNAFLERVVSEFESMYVSDKTHSEIAVYSQALDVCGTIDLLNVTGDMKANIEDIKTNGDLYKEAKDFFLPPFNDMKATKINEYRLQLSIYKHLMELLGWTIGELVLWHYSDKWERIIIEPVTNIKDIWQIEK